MNVNEEHTHKVLSNFWVNGSSFLIGIMSLINHEQHTRLFNSLSLIHSNNNKLHKDKMQQKEVNLTLISIQKVVIEKKIKIHGARYKHTKEEKTN